MGRRLSANQSLGTLSRLTTFSSYQASKDIHAGIKIKWALGPMVGKIACGPSKQAPDGPAGPADF